MRLFALCATTLLLATGLAVLAPAGAAVAWCTSVTNKLNEPDCQHLVCWGRSYDYQYHYERCSFSEDDIPDPCRPGCLLP